MDEERKDRLLQRIENAREMLSNKVRPNAAGEDYEVIKIYISSDDSATVVFKGVNKKRSRLNAVFFYHLNTVKRWEYFVPTFGHLKGFRKCKSILTAVDVENKIQWGN